MSFSEALRTEAEPLFTAIYHHPFIRDIADQKLSREAIIHYVQQDIQYLNTYARVYGLAIAKSHTEEQMRLFHQRIQVVLGGELTPHLNLCRVAGVDYETLHAPTPLAPTAHHYAQHMLTAAYTGSLGDIVAAVLPCHWTYVDLAQLVADEIQIHQTPTHAFYDWITFYASDLMQSGLRELTNLLDRLAAVASASDKQRMKEIFLHGCRLEFRFFDMAYRQERWPI